MVKEKSKDVSQVSAFVKLIESDITLLRKSSYLLYFSVLSEDPDPGSGSDCLPADMFTMRGTGELFT